MDYVASSAHSRHTFLNVDMLAAAWHTRDVHMRVCGAHGAGRTKQAGHLAFDGLT